MSNSNGNQVVRQVIDADSIRADAGKLLSSGVNDDSGEESRFEKIGYTYGELSKLDLPLRKEIIYGLGRGEVGLLNSVNNAGKTTLLRNLMITLCIGIPFPPFGNSQSPKKVAFIDLEDTLAFLRKDLNIMLKRFPEKDRALLNDNAFLICDYIDKRGEGLSLSNPKHLALLTQNLKIFKPDLIIVDTIGSAFQIRDENNNAEVRHSIMRPLKKLAKDVDSALKATHHIGKPKSEEGQTKETSFRGRGASSFADMSRLVLNLEKNYVNDCVTLQCAKVKGPKFDDVKFKLNPEARWFEALGESKEDNGYRFFLQMLNDGDTYKTGELVKKFEQVIPERTVKRYLEKAVENKDFQKIKRGVYQRISALST